MKTLERNRIDGLVREVEAGAYRLALSHVSDAASAERIVLEAFTSLAPSLARTAGTIELREKLYAQIRQRSARQTRPLGMVDDRSDPSEMSQSLHQRIVDVLEEEQSAEPPGRRRAVLAGAIGIVLIAAVIAFVRVHAEALAAAQPTVKELSPPSAATDIPVSGDVRVKFGRRPEGTPKLRLEPAHAVLESVHWDGNTLVAVYTGLHLSTRYELVLQADYRSRLNDIGHFEKRWTVTTQGYPVLSALTPQPDGLQGPRVGKISVDFSYRPPIDPRLSIMPPDGTLTPGNWFGMTWYADYTGLMPLTRYEVTLDVDYGAAAASTRHHWAFSTEPGWPASSMPVIWYGMKNLWTPQGNQRLVAIDWQGNLAGSLYTTSVVLRQAPDGSALLTQDGGYVDGNVVGTAPTPGYPSIALPADDSKSVCNLTGGGQSWLESGPLRGPMHRVASAGSAGARSGVDIIACSVTSDRAVLADNGMAGTTAIRVIALSTGRLLYQRSYAGSSVSVTSSRDGRYVAEQITSVDALGQPSAAFTLVRRINDGRIVARLDNQRVLRFSWDGMRVVTVPFFTGNVVKLIDWQTEKVLWQQAGDLATDFRPAFAMAQPNGPAMAIALGSLPRTSDVDQLWIVSADGQATQVLSTVFYPAFGTGL